MPKTHQPRKTPMPGQETNPWDHHLDCYTRVASPCTGYLAQALFLSAAGRLPTAARILDVACGPGDLSIAAALHCLDEARKTGSAGHVVATDFSPAMVARTRQRLHALGTKRAVSCQVEDGQKLTFEAASFDAVFSSFGIFLFPDRLAGWREAARVLRPGGIFATAVWRGAEHNELARMQMEPLMASLPERIKAGLGQAPWANITTADGLIDEICAVGFIDPEVIVRDTELTAPTPRAMWEMMCDNPVSGAVLGQCSDEELRVVEEAVLESLEATAGGLDRPVRVDASCHFFIARRA